MKIRLLNNLPYNNNKENIPFFNTVEERDTFVEDNLTNENYQWMTSKSFTKTSPTTFSFRMKKDKIQEGFSHTYCMTDIQGKIEFWHIVGTYSTNARTVTYTAELDIHMTYPTVLSEIEQGVMSQGHIPFEKMTGLTFDGGDKVVVDIQKIERTGDTWDSPHGDTLVNNTWMLIYINGRINEGSIALPNEKSFMTGKMNGNVFEPQYSAPFNVIIVPTTPIKDPSDVYMETGVVEAMEAINAGGLSPYVLDIQFTTFTPWVRDTEGNIANLSYWDYDWPGLFQGRTQFMILDFVADFNEPSNEYTVYMPYAEESLDGIRDFDIMIENNKILDIPLQAVEDSINVNFIHRYVPTPNEPEESIQINVGGKYRTIRGVDNIWTKSKDLAYGVNAFAQYKANKPLSSEFEIILSPLRGFLTGASLTTWFSANKFNRYGFTKEKLMGYEPYEMSGLQMSNNEIGYGGRQIIESKGGDPIKKTVLTSTAKTALTFGGVGAISNLSSTVMNRQDMKRRPQQIKGSGSALPDLYLNKQGFDFVRVEYEYTTTERENLLNSIYRDGVSVENYVFDKYENVKRRKFNVIDIVNIDMVLPQKYYVEEGLEIVNNIIEFYKTPRRYWNRLEEFMVFDYTDRSDNG